jgi:hypothetical protein
VTFDRGQTTPTKTQRYIRAYRAIIKINKYLISLHKATKSERNGSTTAKRR